MILAGGSGRRLGVVDKPALIIHGESLLARALAAVEGALTVVVGPLRELGPGIRQTRESPAGGGPAAGLVAGLRVLANEDPDPNDLVVVLAADLPGIDQQVVATLGRALTSPGLTGAALTDPSGRLQYLAGIWRWAPLMAAASSRESWHNGRLSDLLGPLIATVVAADRCATADIDTPEDLQQWSASESNPHIRS